MAMMGLTSGGGGGEAAAVFALLDILADPKKTKARLEELVKVAEQAGEAQAAANGLLAAAVKLETDLAGLKTDLDRQVADVSSREMTLKRDQTNLNDQRATLNRQSTEQADAIASFETQKNSKLKELASREQTVARREEDAANQIKIAQDLAAEYAAKLKAMKQLVA